MYYLTLSIQMRKIGQIGHEFCKKFHKILQVKC